MRTTMYKHNFIALAVVASCFGAGVTVAASYIAPQSCTPVPCTPTASAAEFSDFDACVQSMHSVAGCKMTMRERDKYLKSHIKQNVKR